MVTLCFRLNNIYYKFSLIEKSFNIYINLKHIIESSLKSRLIF